MASSDPRDSSARRLLEELEANHCDWMLLQAEVLGWESRREEEALWIAPRGRTGHAELLRLRFAAEDLGARLERFLDAFRRRRIPARLWVSPLSTPPAIERCLADRGLRCVRRVRAMAADAAHAAGSETGAAPGVEIVLDDDGPAGPGRPGRPAPDAAGLVERLLGLDPRRVWRLRALGAGLAVGSALLFAGRNSAGLYNLEVDPGARGQGIGSALATAALGQARLRGYRDLVLLASRGGERLYRRLGFRTLGEFSEWRYSRAQEQRELEGRTDDG